MHYLTLVHIECCLYIKCRPYTEWHPHYCLVSHGMNTKFKGTIYALWAMEHQECAQIVQQHHSMWFKNTNTGYVTSEYHVYAVTWVSGCHFLSFEQSKHQLTLHVYECSTCLLNFDFHPKTKSHKYKYFTGDKVLV